jgi:hypothetical protein
MGWRPKEEFRGDPDQWTDAKTFVERGEAALPVLRERYRALDDRFANMQTAFNSTRDELREVKATASELRQVLNEFRDRAGKAEQISYARARAELENRMSAAVEQADRDGYARAKGELDRINQMERDSAAPPKPAAVTEPKKDAPAATQQQADPVVTQWVEENPWFKIDQGMAAYATAVFQRLRNERPGVAVRDHLDQMRADVVARFPDKFENPRRNSPSAVNTNPAPPTALKKGVVPPYEQWPAEAKQGYLQAKRFMPDYKPEEYAKLYFTGGES